MAWFHVTTKESLSVNVRLKIVKNLSSERQGNSKFLGN